MPVSPVFLAALVQTGLSPSTPPRDLFVVFASLATRVVSGGSRRMAVLAALGWVIPPGQASVLRGAALRLPLAALGLRHSTSGGSLEASVTHVFFPAQPENLKDSVSAKSVEERQDAWKAKLPKEEVAELSR